MLRHILAIDHGGTKCDAILADAEGTVLGWGHYDAAQPGPESEATLFGKARSAAVFRSTMDEALRGREVEDLHVITYGHARHGFGVEAHGGRWVVCRGEDRFPLPPGVRRCAASLTTEEIPVLAFHGEESGVVALAGTGAGVYARARDGRAHRLDGLGPVLGDYGSAYHIGLLALRAAARSGWHPRHRTTLAPLVRRRFGADPDDPDGSSLIPFSLARQDRSTFALLVGIVDREARTGDAVARNILDQAAAALAETARDQAEMFEMVREDYLMIGMGGVIARSDFYWECLCSRIREWAPRFRFRRFRLPPVLAFPLMVIREFGMDLHAVRSRLAATARPLLEAIPYYQPLLTHWEVPP